MDQTPFTMFILIILLSSVFCLEITRSNLSNLKLTFPCAKFYTKGKLHIECSHKNLTNIPDLPSEAVYIDLEGNLIKEIPNATFEHLKNLTFLDISFNRLTSINRQTFVGIQNLKHLKLNNNFIVSIQNNTFDGMTSLTVLDLSNNNILSMISKQFFKGLINLRHLKLNKSPVMTSKSREIANNTFEYLINLSVLDLSFNNLESINEQTFTGLENLQYLNLNKNKLSYNTRQVPAGCFKPLKSLIRLSIQNNNVYSYPRICIFPDLTIAHLVNLEKIELDVDVGRRVFKNVQCLGPGYASLQNLHSLKFDTCGRLSLFNDSFKHTPHLTHIDIQKCAVTYVKSGALSRLSKLKVLKLDLSGYSDYKLDQFMMVNMVSSLAMTQIEVLDMKDVWETAQTENTFPWEEVNAMLLNTSIRELRFTNNFNVVFPTRKSVPSPQSLQILNLSMNALNEILLNLTHVKFLYLQGNALGKYLGNNSYMIKGETKLEYVCLANNSILNLNSDLFKDQPYLQIIDLSYNSLKEVNCDLSHLVKLHILNLTFNLINHLDYKSFTKLDRILKKSDNILQIDLSYNPVHCNCYTLSFLQWMQRRREHFINFSHLRCQYLNGSISPSNSFEDVVLYIERECMDYSYLIVIAAIAVLIFIAILLTAVIYRHRWKLRYIFYTAKLKYMKKKSDEELTEYVYDAFISYADKDREFVIKDCIENLEQGVLKLCIHQRDFMPGEDITDNIINAIQNSRKTICIITRSFLDSYYCMFEFNMARMESVHSRNGKNTLFLVFYEKLLPEELPLILYELIQNQSYIEYPNDEQGNVIFWQKIKDTFHT
ncbi:TLR13 [Mytilus edulis]|uniref:TLR13 n=2 Tax=Mytilus edulis TaxID=6550 RepID=A0A8S3PSL6_MYTED|nr:TLR13 [Mytilus edulis]